MFDSIISPGTNTNTTSETNNMMVLYMEKVKSLRHKGSEVFFVGVAFLDTLTGEVGTIQYPFKEQLNEAVIYDEIIKLIISSIIIVNILILLVVIIFLVYSLSSF